MVNNDAWFLQCELNQVLDIVTLSAQFHSFMREVHGYIFYLLAFSHGDIMTYYMLICDP